MLQNSPDIEQCSVLLLTGKKHLLDYQRSVLGQPAIALEWTELVSGAFNSLCRDSVKLAIIEQCPDFSLEYFLLRVKDGIQTRLPTFLVVVHDEKKLPLLPFPVQLFDIRQGLPEFSSRVTTLSGSKARRARRHLVRVNFSNAAGSLLGNSHSLSAYGALIKMPKPVAPGVKLQLSLMGVQSLTGVELSATVLRREETPKGETGNFYSLEFAHDPATMTFERLDDYLKKFDMNG